MLEIGQYNVLTVANRVEFGVYLDAGDEGEILLPKREVPEDCQVGHQINVFIYLDSDDRLIATLQEPLARVGEFAQLKVLSVQSIGAFLNWGLSKDLFLPFAEQTRPLRVGQSIIVYLYLDKSSRISASMRLDRKVEKTPAIYEEGQRVDLVIAGRGDLGFKAIIEGRHLGIIYSNDIFQDLQYGQIIEGFIKKIREDGKIDLTLQDPKSVGHRSADPIADRILELLKEEGGFLGINDKTGAESIYQLFGVSKKKYKIALGGLYKKRLITVDEDGIRLV